MARTCTLKGNPLELEGPELKVGDTAPNVTLKKTLVDSVALADTTGSVRILSVVPSLDTPVCAEQTHRFFKAAADLPDVRFMTISTDLPVAMARFCGAENIDMERMAVLSDHMDTSFGKAFGTLIPSLRVESRAVFVLDRDDVIKHVEYVAEVSEHPNYDAVLAAVKSLS